MSYAPATAYTPSVPSSFGAIDASNLTVSFTAPSSGSVLVRVSFECRNGTDDNPVFGLTDHTTHAVVAPLFGGLQIGLGPYIPISFALLITGLTSGGTYQYDLSGKSSSSTLGVVGTGTPSSAVGYAPVTMEVWAAG